MDVNRIRYFHFMAGLLKSQYGDPFCSICKAAANTAVRIGEDIEAFRRDHSSELKNSDAALLRLLEDASKMLSELKFPENAEGQKKAGNCLMPQGVCFIKWPKSLIDKL